MNATAGLAANVTEAMGLGVSQLPGPPSRIADRRSGV